MTTGILQAPASLPPEDITPGDDGKPSLLRRVGDAIYPLTAIIVILVIWELAVLIRDIPHYVLPAPTVIAETVYLERAYLTSEMVPTLIEALLGFFFAVVIGNLLAIAMVTWRALERTLYPLLVASQEVPTIAVAPLFIIWFGLGTTPKVIIAFLIAFFPVVINSAVGLRSVPTEVLNLARSTGATRLAILRRIRLPHALPNIFAGMKLAITLAVIGAIVGEFVGADQGIGYLLIAASGRLDTALVFAGIAVLVAIGLVLFWLVAIVEKLAIPWHISQRQGNEAH